MPQLKSGYFTPYDQSAFDAKVVEYCENRASHNIVSNRNGAPSNRRSFFERRKSTQIFDIINAPAHKRPRNCKVILCGDLAVGKTSLINRFSRAFHSEAYQTTAGVDFDLQRFQILQQPYMLQIWDTAGLERFKCINSAYYRGCQVALLVFDASSVGSLASILRWRDEILVVDQQRQEQEGGASMPLLFLVGAKYDLPTNESSKNFIEEQANKIAQLLEAELWFVSSLTGQNVDELFKRMAALAFNRCILDEMQRNDRLVQSESKPVSSSVARTIVQQTSHSANKLIRSTGKKIVRFAAGRK